MLRFLFHLTSTAFLLFSAFWKKEVNEYDLLMIMILIMIS